MERTFSYAAAAVIAGAVIDRDLSVDQLRHFDRAVILHLADLASAAFLQIDLRHSLADDAQVIQIRLHAVVGTAAHRDLELVRQLDFTVSVIEPLMNLFRQGKCIDQAVLACSSLTGNDRAHLRSCTAGLKTCLHQELSEGLDIVKRNALNLHGQTGGHGHFAAAELLRRLGDHSCFF